MVRYHHPLNRRRYARNAYLNSPHDPLGFGATLVSPALAKPEDYINHAAVSQWLVSKRQSYRSNLQNGYELWAVNCVTEYFTPPRMSPVPGDEDYDEEDHKDSNEEPIDDNDRKTVSVLFSRGAHKRFYRRNGGIYSELRQRGVADFYSSRDQRDNRINVTVMSLDRSGKNAMLVQKYSKSRAGMVDIAVMVDIPGPGSETWAKEGGGGWWGTARETEKLLAVTCRLRMQSSPNGLGVLFGLVTGGTRVRFFKWTDDKKEPVEGRFEDLAVLLGLTDDEEDYDSFSDDEDEEMKNGNGDDLDAGSEHDPTAIKGKGKGKAKIGDFEPIQEDNGDLQSSFNSDDPPPHHTSAVFVPDPKDLFDIRLPPETSRGGYYDMLWQGDKCSAMFHHIGGWKVD
ncbi:hypothetical protein TWF106_010911 [Orbilia oligospora]|uniref:Uncharacterized protein n=1 Tax=Orbilia oligospora TaxID=2813651 RepID=A0A7C8UPX8_ORBOL|nr:hypothetical protein TWF679_000680 [Orbilia oligospora]KAF3209679.1 hypothetical protein TWF106_010911 [Orbilia oligospora]